MADTPATAWSDLMTKLVGNQGGQVESLPDARLQAGNVKAQYSRVSMSTQSSGTVIHVARVPRGGVVHSIDAMTDVSLGSATIKFGNAHDGNSAVYGGGATLTSTDALTRFGPPLAKTGVVIDTCYDYAGNGPLTALKPSPYGGGEFEDIVMTTGAAALPGSGTILVRTAFSPPS